MFNNIFYKFTTYILLQIHFYKSKIQLISIRKYHTCNIPLILITECKYYKKDRHNFFTRKINAILLTTYFKKVIISCFSNKMTILSVLTEIIMTP